MTDSPPPDAEGARRLTAICEQPGSARARRPRRAAHRRRVGPQVLPRPAAPMAIRWCSRVHAGPIEYETLPFVNVARAARRRCRCRSRASSATTTRSASSRCRISATSRCRRTSAPRRPADARGALPPGGGAHRHAAAPRRRAGVDRVSALRRRLRRREADLGARLLPQALPRGLSRRACSATPSARRSRASARVIVEELAAEPRVLCHRDYHSRNLMLHQGRLYMIDFQDARHGPRHLRPGVAAARLLRRPAPSRARTSSSPTSWR